MSKFTTLIKTTLTPIALCLTLAIAAPAIAKKGHHQKHDAMHQVLSELSLTDTQEQDVRQILKKSREDRGLFSSATKSLKKELRSLVQTAEWDQGAIESAITQRQALMQARALQRASYKNQVWNLLTDTQQAEFIALLDTRKVGLETHRGEHKEKDKGYKLKRLDLTQAQLSTVQAIRNEAKTSDKRLIANIKNYKQAERALIHNTGFNAEAWQTLNSQYQADFLAMAVLRAKTKHDIWNQLTPEQQAKSQEKNNKRNKGKKRGKRNKPQNV